MESFSLHPPRAKFGEMLRLEYTTTQEVEITDITKNGAHTFSCFGENNSIIGPATHVEFQMIHKAAPKIASNFGKNPEKLVTKSFGDSIILKCSVEEMSIRNFSWFKDGRRLSACDNGSRTIHHDKFNISFLIEKITQDDAGVYSCKAMNLFGRDEHFFELKVRGKGSAKRNFFNSNSFVPDGGSRGSKNGIMCTISIILFMTVAMLILFIKFHLAKKRVLELEAAGLGNFEEGNLGSLNKSLSLNEQANLLPYDSRIEFPKEKLILKEQLGSGAFGVVFKALAIGIEFPDMPTTVAVKTVTKSASNEMIKALVVEMKIMLHIGQHANVVNLLGAITKNITRRSLMVIFEYCHHGDLKSFLLENRRYFSATLRKLSNDDPKRSLSLLNLVSWS